MKTRRQYRLEYAMKLLKQDEFIEKIVTELQVKSKPLADRIRKIDSEITK